MTNTPPRCEQLSPAAPHDENLPSRCSGEPGALKAFLDERKYEGGISIHWIVVGPSRRRARPAAGGVLRHYRRCDPHVHPAIKTIANTFYLSGLAAHPHNFRYRCAAAGYVVWTSSDLGHCT